MKTIFLAICITVAGCAILPKNYTIQKYYDNPAVQRFRQYVQIDTSKEENLMHKPAGKPVCVISWPGSDPGKPSIMLNSHMDVVPVEADQWKFPPFSAHIDENGDIFGRGTQDDKDVAIQYIEAIRRLQRDNVTLCRTLHVTLMPDEEKSGKSMEAFIKTKEFEALNVGFALDEGLTSLTDTMFFTYHDKRAWQMKISVRGIGGHSASIGGDTAVEKLQRIMNEIDAHRQAQRKIMLSRDSTDYGAYDSVNINVVHGDVELYPNVVPAKMYMVVDCRLAVSRSVDEMQNLVDSWLSAGGNGTQIEYIRRVERSDAVQLDGSEYWTAIQQWAQESQVPIQPVVCPAISDSVYLRSLGIPSLGFAPKTHTASRIHGADEYLNAATFLRGIDVYVTLLKKLGNL
ncbi:peptidase family m20/M25/M40 domain-containing protein [Phthorimaea operculella]|nr:peptidase family m20/M25/M40 domain-containing protein [Phthorimaea operculella]